VLRSLGVGFFHYPVDDVVADLVRDLVGDLLREAAVSMMPRRALGTGGRCLRGNPFRSCAGSGFSEQRSQEKMDRHSCISNEADAVIFLCDCAAAVAQARGGQFLQSLGAARPANAVDAIGTSSSAVGTSLLSGH
jgi:hypothetical protein